MENLFFSIAFAAYTVGMVLYLGYAFTRREPLAQFLVQSHIGYVRYAAAIGSDDVIRRTERIETGPDQVTP